jgi:hypothetical protein
MGCIIKIENENGEQLFCFQYTNSERCTDLYRNLTEDQYFQSNKMTISLLSEESQVVSTHRYDLKL